MLKGVFHAGARGMKAREAFMGVFGASEDSPTPGAVKEFGFQGKFGRLLTRAVLIWRQLQYRDR